MKFARKCPICHREATKRIGKLDFCDTHAKNVRKNRDKYIWTDEHIYTMVTEYGKCAVYRDYLISVY